MRFCVSISFVLVIMTFALYWQVGEHDFLILDDSFYITQNSHVATGMSGANSIWAFTSLYTGNWHPLTWLSHQLDVQLYGLNPRGHHLANVAYHAGSAVLLFLFLFRFTGALWRSAFVASMFAVHPLHVESVAWVAERKDVLSAFWGFLALFFYSEYAISKKAGIYLLAFASFIVGLMAKPMLVTLPLLMLVLDYWPLKRFDFVSVEFYSPYWPRFKSLVLPLLREKIPFFVCTCLSAAITIIAQNKGGAMPGMADMSVRIRIENSVVAYGKYIFQMLYPHDLAVLYPMPSSFSYLQISASLFALALITSGTLYFRQRRPYLISGWLWFLVTLLPVIGLVKAGSQAMADRYTYIPLTGLFIMIAWGVPEVTRKHRYQKYVFGLLAGLVIGVSTILTWHQLGFWRNDISLYRHALEVTTDNYIMHSNLGVALMNKGEPDAAIQEYGKALAIAPQHVETYNNLGIAFVLKNEPEKAIGTYRTALGIDPNNALTHTNLGSALGNKGELDMAIKEFEEALRINPVLLKAQENLRIALDLRSKQNAIKN
jgi:tetratricopeptide (TPR) repeat protein